MEKSSPVNRTAVRKLKANIAMWEMLPDLSILKEKLEGTKSVWEIFVFAAQLCCEPKTTLNNKIYVLTVGNLGILMKKISHYVDNRSIKKTQHWTG